MKTFQDDLKIDVNAIAKGGYDMIPEDDKACLVFGMLPHKYIEVIESVLLSILKDRAAPYIAFNTDVLGSELAKKENTKIDEFIKDKHEETMKKISLLWLRYADNEGILKV